ncbi:N-acetylneuraminate synthase [Salinimicrobium tongyeongense]|uniref:N-acetylneuraminate synthase n=1 Tax=Salinimicrobium tongyeongense TaxID=2809707 RepID=A0ABY6NRK2_9FLAO|nr:N-acetylneuraminate synthase [Salinimicrobium tongyeongense]UZH55527.1 N-acetylneuraminate synthase [Salinimicrobium tongyeongense]
MQKVLIIAEAGVNHNGNIEEAKKLIDAAALAGADFVKFQTFKTENVVSRSAKRAKYQDLNTGNDDTQFQMIKKLELSEEDHKVLKSYCKDRKIGFLSTGFDLESLEFLNSINIPLFKIPSGEITNLPYLRKISSFKKPVVMSTGMADMQEIKNALEVLIHGGMERSKITVVHCNTEYPTPMKDVNLMAMLHIRDEFGVQIGYSDHTLGIEVPIAAVALGATVIEKHFTLDRNLPGPDHRASLEPDELKVMVQSIRNIEVAISGSGRKEPSASEKENKAVVRKSLIATASIKKGEKFTKENLGVKRPGIGISPMKWDKIVGSRAEKDYKEDELI